ncbi:MAG: right-handed parallel beta-helix repeat-containing protein [Nitrospirae bacterium]|nr:right-handed parallel beta-helix repeat-containing protein [Nitrospirota bacterium]
MGRDKLPAFERRVRPLRGRKWFTIFQFEIVFLLLTALPALCATYYVSATGKDSAKGDITGPWRTVQHASNVAVAGDTVYIRTGTYNERVVVTNTGVAGGYITFSAYPGESPTIDGKGVAVSDGQGLFDFTGRSYLKISGLRIINSASAALFAYTPDNIILTNNYTYNSVSSGIGIWGGSNVTIDNNEVELACNDGAEESITIAGTYNFEVMNNLVHDGGPGDYGGEGIDVKSGSHDGTIHDNTVYNINAVCIYIDAYAKHTYNIGVYNNEVFNCSTDGFGIASEEGGLLENVSLYNNLSYNNTSCGINMGNYGVVSVQPLNNIAIYNNTLYKNGKQTFGGGIYISNPNAQNVVVRNNIVSGNYTFQIVKAQAVGDTVTIDNNLVNGFRGYTGETYGTNSITGDPMFVNASVYDLHLQTSSPAIGAASTLNVPAFDFNNRIRPRTQGYDLGAFEYVGTPPNLVILGNGVNGVLNISSKKKLTMSLSFDSGNKFGTKADWWLVMVSNSGVYSYNLNGGTWTAGITPVLQGSLVDVPEQSLDLTGLPPGTYTFYIGVDTNMNGVVDPNVLYYNYLTVNVSN